MTTASKSSISFGTQWYKETVTVFMKGQSFQYTTTLLLVEGMDISRNKLNGSIPEELCALSGLINLNFSHNSLTDKIPNEIGNLKLMESLDLSDNQLFGPIPLVISTITTLNHLNLSYNDSSGRIPTGSQLQTLNDASIYAGNPHLCGDPLTKKCHDEPAKPPSSPGQSDEEEKKEKILFWFIVTAGYATGLWVVIGTLVFKRHWRIAYFLFVDNAKEWIIMIVTVKVARLKRRIQRFSAGE